ncbi:MAG: hypothetical protein GY906_13035 [bacterium]|nr:hypothetical protein [bacterium]
MNELSGEERVCPPRLPQDIAMHDPRGALEVMHSIADGFRPFEVVKRGGEIEPGDVIVVGPVGGGPGHGMVVGATPNAIWHSTGQGVQFTGLGNLHLMRQRIFRVYRYLEKHLWLK